MKTLFVVLVLGFGALTFSAKQPDSLVAHEWGTFTSVANENGEPVRWASWIGSTDLPCFVERLDGRDWKPFLSGFVRMETPVVYFYSPQPAKLSVHVDFPQGWITEWYPKAKVSRGGQFSEGQYGQGQITWDSVDILPGANLQFPAARGASHYFFARNTEAAPLRVGDQQEKLLFYRGVGNFQPPLRPKYLSEGKLEIRNAGPNPIPLAVVFENRAGKTGYRLARGIRDTVTVSSPELTGDSDRLQQDLVTALIESGLYRKEAEAMVNTWRDSWFEEGTRVFYLYPRAQVDAALPLSITPRPASLGRVFVGRVEVLSPWSRQTIEAALHSGDTNTLAKFGRFLEPFIQQIRRTDPAEPDLLRTSTALAKARQEAQNNGQSSCVE